MLVWSFLSSGAFLPPPLEIDNRHLEPPLGELSKQLEVSVLMIPESLSSTPATLARKNSLLWWRTANHKLAPALSAEASQTEDGQTVLGET